jgi:hypothetical protein
MIATPRGFGDLLNANRLVFTDLSVQLRVVLFVSAGGIAMDMLRSVVSVAQYISEAIVAIFTPIHDDVPPVGVQPFRMDPPGEFDDWPQAMACPLACSIVLR